MKKNLLMFLFSIIASLIVGLIIDLTNFEYMAIYWFNFISMQITLKKQKDE